MGFVSRWSHRSWCLIRVRRRSSSGSPFMPRG
ncbi:unnamed protein product [Linum tenue]|uniref:Uncharacterized protein n=1 Tax=Linum tenue TaxID=586396 RepID=A0AAV0RND1_9ROSI|nr:unnamed protein product [Linum tenue]